MKKKSQVITFYDIFAWIILILGMTVWLIIFRHEGAGKDYIIKNQVQNLNHDDIFITMLRTNFDSGHLSDILLLSYSRRDPEMFVEKTELILQEMYSGEVCWKLLVDESVFIDRSCSQESENDLLNAIVYLPLKGESLSAKKVQLIVMGRRE